MKYRKLSASNDFTFGRGQSDFYKDVPEAVAQACQTRLSLATGDWFLNLLEGTPYFPKILGHGTTNLYDIALKQRILGTPGVKSLDAYQSSLDPNTRKLSVTCLLTTIYGQIIATVSAENTNPLAPGRLDSTFILDQSILI